MLSNLDLQVSFPRPIVIVNAIGARCISKGGLWIYMLMHTSNTLIDTRVWFDMISSRTCSFPPCLSCFYMVSFGLPKRVVCVCVCVRVCTHVRTLLRSCPKLRQCISGWFLGTGIRHRTTGGFVPGTWPPRPIKQVKVNTILYYTVLTYVCDTLVRFMTMEVMLPETMLEKNIMLLLLQDGGVNHWSFKTGHVNT